MQAYRRTIAGLAALAVCSLTVVLSAEEPASRPSFDHSAFDAILKEAVKGERVDYKLIKSKHYPQLAGYVAALSGSDIAAMDEKEQLAAYINLYNAAMIKAVIDRYKPGYRPSDDNYSIFKTPAFTLAGEPTTLDHLEHGIIRKQFTEPRVHTALVCAAVSCPPLIPRAYTAADLDETLEANMKRFVNDANRNPIDSAGKKLRLSQIFNWFAVDFGGPAAVPGYVARYHDAQGVASWPVEFVEYDWTLNEVK